jgi:hypothetical protein
MASWLEAVGAEHLEAHERWLLGRPGRPAFACDLREADLAGMRLDATHFDQCGRVVCVRRVRDRPRGRDAAAVGRGLMAWEWRHAEGLETMCVSNADLGFFQALPGCPWEVSEPARPGQVPVAYQVMIGELEMPIRYYVMRRPPQAIEPELLAPLLARTWAQARAVELGETRPAPIAQRTRFGVESAGSVQYALKPDVVRGADTEETLALVRDDSCNGTSLWRAIDKGLSMVQNAYDLHGFAITLWREVEV